ncbi:MAG: MCP four helix bundle domain-containing protein, partial [Burkholderiales bacterium]
MRIGLKLTCAFTLVLALTVAIGGSALLSLSKVNTTSAELADKWLPSAGHLSVLRAAMLDYRELTDKHTKSPDASYMAEYEDKMAVALKVVDTTIAAYEKLIASVEERDLFATLVRAWSEHLKISKGVVELSRAGKQEDAREVSEGAGRLSLEDGVTAIDKLIAFDFDGSARVAQDAARVYDSARRLTIALLAAALVIGALLATIITRSITRPMRNAVRACEAIAQGDLDQRIDVRTTEETGQLLRAMQTMADTLKGFYAAQQEMKRQHDAGAVSHRIEANRFNGSYGEMATITNELVAAHIAVTTQVVTVVSRYADGDLSIDMAQLPGENAKVTESMAAV